MILRHGIHNIKIFRRYVYGHNVIIFYPIFMTRYEKFIIFTRNTVSSDEALKAESFNRIIKYLQHVLWTACRFLNPGEPNLSSIAIRNICSENAWTAHIFMLEFRFILMRNFVTHHTVL